MDYKALLIMLISNTDLEVYVKESEKLDYAVEFAKRSIANRCGCAIEQIPDTYSMNVVEGAKWYLSRIGTEGEIRNVENGITREFKTIPDWLKSVVPAVTVVNRRVRTK